MFLWETFNSMLNSFLHAFHSSATMCLSTSWFPCFLKQNHIGERFQTRPHLTRRNAFDHSDRKKVWKVSGRCQSTSIGHLHPLDKCCPWDISIDHVLPKITTGFHASGSQHTVAISVPSLPACELRFNIIGMETWTLSRHKLSEAFRMVRTWSTLKTKLFDGSLCTEPPVVHKKRPWCYTSLQSLLHLWSASGLDLPLQWNGMQYKISGSNIQE